MLDTDDTFDRHAYEAAADRETSICEALAHVRAAARQLQGAGAVDAAARVRASIQSIRGAIRHAERVTNAARRGEARPRQKRTQRAIARAPRDAS